MTKAKTPKKSTPKTKKKMGRPPWEPTAQDRYRAKTAAMMGMSEIETERFVGKHIDTIKKHCKAELDEGRYGVNSQVANRLFERCMDGEVTALIYWTKAKMGWTDKPTQELESQAPPVVNVYTSQAKEE